MRYRALLLDFYGTLVEEDDRIINEILSAIAEISPVSSDPKRIGRDWQLRFHESCSRAYAENFQPQRAIEAECLSNVLTAYQVRLKALSLAERLFAYWQAPHAYEDGMRFVQRVSLPICIVSNIDTHDLLAAMKTTGLQFNYLVTSEACRSYKPRPEMFVHALDKLGCRASEVLHVGDSMTSDIVGARECGIDAAWVNRNGKPWLSTGVTPTFTVTNLDELLVQVRASNYAG